MMAGNGYLFVYETLLNQMESHLLTPGMQLPSEVDLARELGVSRMTTRKALTRLEEENRIFRRVGSGPSSRRRRRFLLRRRGGSTSALKPGRICRRSGRR